MFVFDLLKDFLLPYKSLVFLAMFVAFFSLLGLAIRHNEDTRARKAFLAFFFVCLLLTSLGGQHVLPFTQWHKFSTTGEENVSFYQIEMISEDGSRIVIDPDVTEVASRQLVASEFASGYSESEREQAAQILIHRSNQYRAKTLDREVDLFSLIDFPPHGYGTTDWSSEYLSEHGQFTGVAIVRVDLQFSADGESPKDRSTEDVCVYKSASNASEQLNSQEWGVSQCS